MLFMPFTYACIVQNTVSAAHKNYLVRSAAGGLACIAEPTFVKLKQNLHLFYCIHISLTTHEPPCACRK